MKVSGVSQLNAEREAVWHALNDPAVLVRTIPGCQRLESIGDDAYKMTVFAGVGAIKGVYDGEVRLHDQQEPGSFRMHAQGAGAPGTIGADVVVTLSDGEGGGTELTYDADATVGGMIGGVGQRMLTGVSKRMAAEFFGNVDTVLAGGTTAPPQAVSEALSVAGASGGLPEGGGAGIQARSARPPDPSTPTPPPSVRPPGVAAGQVFTAPAAGLPAGPSGFALGVAVGAAAALAGAFVGGWLSRRRN